MKKRCLNLETDYILDSDEKVQTEFDLLSDEELNQEFDNLMSHF